MGSDDDQTTAECKRCETALSGEDLTYRVLYGTFEQTHDGVVSDKLVAGPGETIDPGADERYYCFDCYKQAFARESGAHFEYESPDELWAILEASNGRLVADAKPMTVGGRQWVRVVDGEVEARHSVRIQGGEDDDWDIGFETEPTPDFDKDRFEDFFAADREIRLVYLKPVGETPLVAGQNRTLGAVRGTEGENA
ncbi:hypothetical protein [Natrinema thermotolerans]|uniref:hypothetical protein n=1 Tax=Natrinema thermotolerans TaxID=121872 RepID=UPI000679E894|nr:hypothetical protein [Natrinema thermotolerans]QCC57234.1 hypothetical protein DVR14_00745 [Natrinema thermotolerans]